MKTSWKNSLKPVLVKIIILSIFLDVAALENIKHLDATSPKASDNNPGTKDSPWKTLEHAGATAVAGDKVIIHPGIYKGTLSVKNSGTKEKPIIFEGSKLGEVIIDGSKLVANWKRSDRDPRIWEADCEMKLRKYPFTGKYLKYYNRTDPRDLAMDGMPLFFVGENKLPPGSWTTNDKKNKLLLRLPDDGDPNSHQMSIVNTFAGVDLKNYIDKTKKTFPEYVTIRNLQVKRYQCGIRLWGGHNTVENNIIEWSEMWGILCKLAHDGIIRNNSILWSGHLGSGAAHRMRFTGNKIFFSNWKLSTPGWDASAIKTLQQLDIFFEGNECAYNATLGIWLDYHLQGVVVKDNIVRDNIAAGLEGEACFGNTWEGNVSYRNSYGFYIGNSSNELIKNNIFADNTRGLHFRFQRNRYNKFLRASSPDTFSKKLEKLRPYTSSERLEKWAKGLATYTQPCFFVRNNIIEKNIFLNNRFEVCDTMARNLPDHSESYMIEGNNFIDDVFVNADPKKVFSGYNSLTAYAEKRITGEIKNCIYQKKLDIAKLPAWAQNLYEKHRKRLEYPRSYTSIAKIYKSLAVKNPYASLYPKKPAPAGLLALARICESERLEKIDFSDPKLQPYLITYKKQPTLIMWREHGKPGDHLPILLKGIPESAKIETSWGQIKPIKRKGDLASINVGTWPIYLLGVDVKPTEIQPFTVEIPKQIPRNGEIKIAIRNAISDGELYIDSLFANLNCPDRIVVKNRNAEFKATILADDYGLVKIRIAGQLGQLYAGKTIEFSTSKKKSEKDVSLLSGFKPISLKAVANCRLDKNSEDELLKMSDIGASLDAFPSQLKLAEIPFVIEEKSCVGLATSRIKKKRPAMVSIPMNGQKLRALAFLQVVAYAPKEKGEELFHYRLNYGDFFTASTSIKNKIHIFDWWSEPDTRQKALLKKNSSWLAWSGDCGTGHFVNAYVHIWINPNPDKEIASLEIAGGDAEKKTTSGLLAISVLKNEK